VVLRQGDFLVLEGVQTVGQMRTAQPAFAKASEDKLVRPYLVQVSPPLLQEGALFLSRGHFFRFSPVVGSGKVTGRLGDF
jgi:hypothetical protein